MKLIFRVCCGGEDDDLDDEQPRIVRLNGDYGEYGGGGGGGGGVGSEIDTSEEGRIAFTSAEEDGRARNRITPPVPIPEKFFPSPKILRVITTPKEEEKSSAVSLGGTFSIPYLSLGLCSCLFGFF